LLTPLSIQRFSFLRGILNMKYLHKCNMFNFLGVLYTQHGIIMIKSSGINKKRRNPQLKFNLNTPTGQKGSGTPSSTSGSLAPKWPSRGANHSHKQFSSAKLPLQGMLFHQSHLDLHLVLTSYSSLTELNLGWPDMPPSSPINHESIDHHSF
jgi:hypothetical protein